MFRASVLGYRIQGFQGLGFEVQGVGSRLGIV